MKFLTLVFALVLAVAWDGLGRLQSDDWYRGWQKRVAAWRLPPALGLALAVLGPAALAYLALDALQPVLFGLVWFALALVLLLYALGRGDFAAQMEHYRRQARSGDFEGAFLHQVTETPSRAEGEEPASPADVHEMAQHTLLYEGYQRWFAVVFYFMLLGPAAALAYRLLQLCRDHLETDLAIRCLFVIDWIPSRLLAATFAVTGDFVGSRDELVDSLQDGSRQPGRLLHEVGAAAVASPPSREDSFGLWAAEQNEEFGSLLKRSAGAWLVVISLCVVFL